LLTSRKRQKFSDAASNIRRIDSAVAEVGYMPMKKQPKPTLSVTIRHYQNDHGDKLSLAFTESDLLLPPTEIGLMVQARVARAKSNRITGEGA
jgi:hypothetical protein